MPFGKSFLSNSINSVDFDPTLWMERAIEGWPLCSKDRSHAKTDFRRPGRAGSSGHLWNG
ncbi:hypothetical protein MPL3365_130508 [Mesorhizobium plurifarium]|uniref:Uncharacterized protein n=1 Tax=Mesorhizobium plurifarium TaxID=69974 RepID=A0A090G3E2_MESPL|nr:hypothetical protein MPL3365_130508 [Mesorhizobium plurifarium]